MRDFPQADIYGSQLETNANSRLSSKLCSLLKSFCKVIVLVNAIKGNYIDKLQDIIKGNDFIFQHKRY